MAPKGKNVRDIIRDLVLEKGTVRAGEIAEAAHVSRQAAHYHLQRMVRSGELQALGHGRGARYARDALLSLKYDKDGLSEDIIWRELLQSRPELGELRENVHSIIRYVFTEMVNNAIDHSRAEWIAISYWMPDSRLAFEVADSGIGIFKNIQENLGLKDEFAAIQELSKGKVTTDPARHTGEGIFFSSRVVDLFTVRSGRIKWTVDNNRRDQAVGEAAPRDGTSVGWEIDRESSRTLRAVFDAHTDPETFKFARTGTDLRLFNLGVNFVSRSEAKRLTHGLERFSEVTVDFSGVEEVGQGFIDELFRVWAREHPETKLVPINMSPPVRAMVERGLRRSEELPP
jgi:anti-sigma regulatory factor (Ser/Thr protein kinase)